jgi:hypothetical protein
VHPQQLTTAIIHVHLSAQISISPQCIRLQRCGIDPSACPPHRAEAGKFELDGAQYAGFALPFSISQLVWLEVILVGGAEFYRNGELDPEKRIYPGGVFDPLGFATGDDDRAFRLKTAEIKHARLAMTAFLGAPSSSLFLALWWVGGSSSARLRLLGGGGVWACGAVWVARCRAMSRVLYFSCGLAVDVQLAAQPLPSPGALLHSQLLPIAIVSQPSCMLVCDSRAWQRQHHARAGSSGCAFHCLLLPAAASQGIGCSGLPAACAAQALVC